MPSRRLPVLLCLVLLALVAAAPAAAWADTYDDTSGDWVTTDDGTATDAPAPAGDGTDPAEDDAALPAVPISQLLPPSTGSGPAPAAPAPAQPLLPPVPITRTIPGTVARIRTDGKAAIPRGAPKRVQQAIAAANKIIGKPYKWGGGHARLVDKGYDCSGAVSYALIGGGLLGGVMVSGSLAHWDQAGHGHWITVYANKGHVYAEIAGLRLDTSPVGDPTGRMGVRWRPLIGRRHGFAARHPLGL
jgi:hypothetical protein